MTRLQELKDWILHYEHEIIILQAEIAVEEAEING
jgi:hypothetical protein